MSQLLSRAEDNEQRCQALLQKLGELQNADSLVKMREHKDAVVASLKKSHESQVQDMVDDNR